MCGLSLCFMSWNCVIRLVSHFNPVRVNLLIYDCATRNEWVAGLSVEEQLANQAQQTIYLPKDTVCFMGLSANIMYYYTTKK